MKTTIELPNSTIEHAKTLAKAQGISVEELLAKTIEQNLCGRSLASRPEEPRWMQGFGGLADLKEENARIMMLIDNEFEQIEPEDLQ
jgi:hypothetical protein